MLAPLIVVDEAFVARGRGVLLSPRFTADGRHGALRVRLRRPDGGEREARAEIEVSHTRGALPPYAMLRLPDLTVADVPSGTEIWPIE